ncbi:hypothetical protein ACIBJF_40090 [Streptomyces sp. NPDC050743]|uniref:hypothetical protein n=1 Tax=Streptomyces sp. NPDC050743 TaxID=3365634 RepID=UPI00379322F2
MHRRSTISRWIRDRWFGKSRRAQAEISRGGVVDQHATELAALLTVGLKTRVVLRRRSDGTALFLLDADGRLLRNFGGDRQASKDRRELKADSPIPVAIIFRDPALWYAPDLPVIVHLEPVAGTSVGSAGQWGHTVADATTHIIRHYRPALDPTAEPGLSDILGSEVPALGASDG